MVLAHLQRGDVWWSFAPTLAQTLFFFFPPIRYAARQWELGCESASDAAALRVVGCTPYAYGGLLVQIAEQLRPAASPLEAGATPANAQSVLLHMPLFTALRMHSNLLPALELSAYDCTPSV